MPIQMFHFSVYTADLQCKRMRNTRGGLRMSRAITKQSHTLTITNYMQSVYNDTVFLCNITAFVTRPRSLNISEGETANFLCTGTHIYTHTHLACLGKLMVSASMTTAIAVSFNIRKRCFQENYSSWNPHQ